jgi:hypothetical protein
MTESTPIRRLLVYALAAAVLAAPVLAQTSEVEEARQAAEADAKRDVSGLMWLGAGCLFNVIGVGLAYLVTSTPQTSRLLGKSSEYVGAYTEAYTKTVRVNRVTWAAIGCAVGTVVGTVVVAWMTYRAANAAFSCLEDLERWTQEPCMGDW